MVEITINKFKDVDIRTIANFIFDTRQASVFQNTSRTVEGIESTLQELVADENQIVIIASSGGKIAQLEADVGNEPAINLYKMFGFEQVHTQEYYAWRVE
ncbi:MAG: hypothetical protein KAU48_08235 [Candidatus Thorarchaeota archaeon]|nr:hypothetical protein [Candidatus Thorarchaeota archaeon]